MFWVYSLAVLSPAEIAGLLSACAALIGAITVIIKFGFGERGSLTISQAQGAATILDAALQTLNKEVERKDNRIDELEEENESLRRELARLRGHVTSAGETTPELPPPS